MALAVPSRLWLGGVISPHRDRALITRLVQMVRASVPEAWPSLSAWTVWRAM